MKDLKSFDLVLCKVTQIIALNMDGYDFYEVVLKDNGNKGTLFCTKEPQLTKGQEFEAEYIHTDVDGKYVLQNPLHEINSSGQRVLKHRFQPPLPRSGKIIQFPLRPPDRKT